MDKEQKKADIVQLLQDYLNFLPSGSDEAYVSVTAGNEGDSGMPLTKESLKRMDKTTLVGETYDYLDKALRRLKLEVPFLHHTIYYLYLVDGVGHSDVAHLRTTKHGLVTIARHDLAIDYLAEYLENVELYVRQPQKLPIKGNNEQIENRHSELEAVYIRYREQGLKRADAIENAAINCDYSVTYATNIITKRKPQIRGKMNNDPTHLVGWIKTMVSKTLTDETRYLFDDIVQDAIIAVMVLDSDDVQDQKNAARRTAENQLTKYTERLHKTTVWQNSIDDMEGEL